MGKNATGEKPKFDLITVSKTKKFKIITGVILAIGVLLLVFGIIMHSSLTSAVTPNALTIADGTLSSLDNDSCTLSQDEIIVLSTSTPQNRALANPIKFELDAAAQTFLEVRDKTDSYAISSSNYQGMFWLHIRDNAPEYLADDSDAQIRPSGYLTITCGSKALRIKVTYHKV